MGLLSFLRPNRRKIKPPELCTEELDAEGLRDLEKTLAEHSGFIVLRGEKLRRYEERMENLTKLFCRSVILPPERPASASHARLQRSSQEGEASGPTGRSLDSAHDFVNSTPSDRDLSSALHSEPAKLTEAIRVGPDVDSPMFNKDIVSSKIEDTLSSSEEEEEIPAAAILLESNPEDSMSADTVPLTEMHDLKRLQPLTSFADFNTPFPMKVSAFVDRQTQCVSSSRTEETDRSPQPRTPEKDRSTTAGLLFSVDSYKMPLHSKTASVTTASSSDVDYEAGEVLLTRFRQTSQGRDRTFRSSHVSISPNIPVNVWDDVPPTRLHVHPINV